LVCPVLAAPKFKDSQLQHGDTAILNGHGGALQRSLSPSQARTLDEQSDLTLCVLVLADCRIDIGALEQRHTNHEHRCAPISAKWHRGTIGWPALHSPPRATSHSPKNEPPIKAQISNQLHFLVNTEASARDLAAVKNKSSIAIVSLAIISLATLPGRAIRIRIAHQPARLFDLNNRQTDQQRKTGQAQPVTNWDRRCSNSKFDDPQP